MSNVGIDPDVINRITGMSNVGIDPDVINRITGMLGQGIDPQGTDSEPESGDPQDPEPGEET